MKHNDWRNWTDAEAVKRRAGGRRRYNAMRRRRAKARRGAISEWLAENPTALFFNRGLPGALGRVFGVHPSTIWRDLQEILYGGQIYNFRRDGELLFTITRACPGGRILSVTDADGNDIRGESRRAILRRMPRYYG